MSDTTPTILVTGATGAIGYETVRTIRARHPHSAIVLVVRREPAPDLRALGCSAIEADLQALGDGPGTALDGVLAETTHVLHLAADVRWNQELVSSMEANARVTERLLAACRRAGGRLRRFVYVSTAYAHPPARHPTARTFIERDGVAFANSYEYSKYVGELHVRASGLPFSIVRPSLVLGSRRDGRIARFNGLYLMAQYACTGRVPFVIAVGSSPTDLVPVDLVAESVADAMDDPELEGSIALVCQGGGGIRVTEMMTVMEELVNRFRRDRGHAPLAWPALIDPDRYERFFRPFMEPEMTPAQLVQMEVLKLFQPYLSALGPIDQAHAGRLYQGPPTVGFLEKAMDFWLQGRSKRALSTPYQWKAAPKPARPAAGT